MPLYDPNMNAKYNQWYESKTKGLEKALKEKQYSSYLYLHEKPYRLAKFVEIAG